MLCGKGLGTAHACLFAPDDGNTDFRVPWEFLRVILAPICKDFSNARGNCNGSQVIEHTWYSFISHEKEQANNDDAVDNAQENDGPNEWQDSGGEKQEWIEHYKHDEGVHRVPDDEDISKDIGLA